MMIEGHPDLVRIGFSFLLAVLGLGVAWTGELTLHANDGSRTQRHTGLAVRVIGVAWIVAAAIAWRHLPLGAVMLIVVTAIGWWWLARRPG